MTHHAGIKSRETAGTPRETGEVNVGRVERWASAVAGGFLAMRGLRRIPLGGIALTLAGGYLLYRGATGHCGVYRALGVTTDGSGQGFEVTETITVNRPPEEAYNFWRNIENLPSFMRHLESVRVMEGGVSRWTALAPAGVRVEWDSEVTEDRANELIRWRSLPGSSILHEGIVLFRPAPGGRGTELKVQLSYLPPLGGAVAPVSGFIRSLAGKEIREDLYHFKQIIETGEVATVEGQASGRAA